MDQANDEQGGDLRDDGRSFGSHSPQHLTYSISQTQKHEHVHHPNNNIGVQHSNTIQQQNHHRSHSLDSPTPPSPRPNMDPTGMFRNRGRRSIKRSNVVSLPSPSRMVGTSNSYRPPPISPTNNNNSNTSYNHNNQQQDRYRTLYDSPQLPQQSLVSNASQNEITTQQQQQQSSTTTPSSTANNNDSQYPLQTSIDNNTPYAKLTDKYQSVEATPLHTLLINNNDSSQDGSNYNNSQDNTDDSNSADDEQEAHSTIGSTVSVMGSIVGDDEDDKNNNNNKTKYDSAKLLEVKLRMMRDVQEVVEEEDQDDQEIDKETDTNMDSLQNESNVVKVADFSQQSDSAVDATTTSTDQKNTHNNNNNNNNSSSSNNTNYESPFRESLKRLTPNRAISSSAIIDKAANTASILPQLARQCFSFEDTTVDDDNFLIMRDQLHMKIEGGETGRRKQLDTHKYYGLSAVASLSDHDDDDDNDDDSPVSSMRNNTTAALDNILQRNAPKWFPPQRTKLFNEESTGTPFRVIRHAQTWDNNNIDGSSKRMQHPPGLRQTSSFDPWSPQRVNRVSRVVQPLGNKIESFPKNSIEDVVEAKDWKVCVFYLYLFISYWLVCFISLCLSSEN